MSNDDFTISYWVNYKGSDWVHITTAFDNDGNATVYINGASS